VVTLHKNKLIKLINLQELSLGWSVLQHIWDHHWCVSAWKMWVILAAAHGNSKSIVWHLTAFKHFTTIRPTKPSMSARRQYWKMSKQISAATNR